jgi:hypothetical protein
MDAAHIDHFRMYADSDGESHIQELTFAFQVVDATSANGA